MIIECVGIHHKALNPSKKYKFFTTYASVYSYLCTCIRNNPYARVNLHEMCTKKSC